MNDIVTNCLDAYVVSGTVAVLATIVLGLKKSLTLAGWPAQERKQAVWSATVALASWFLATLLLSLSGFYRATPSRPPSILYGVLVPIVLGVLLFWNRQTVRRLVQAVPEVWLVGVQAYRALGWIFLPLYANRRLPVVFACVGVGDLIVAVLVPILGIASVQKWRNADLLLRAWNLFGIGVLVAAMMAGVLALPSRFQVFAFAEPSEPISVFPLAMIAVFLVPLAMLLHLASLTKLGKTTHATNYRT
jgi:hypothetical protein